jgi:hypothetical protein
MPIFVNEVVHGLVLWLVVPPEIKKILIDIIYISIWLKSALLFELLIRND